MHQLLTLGGVLAILGGVGGVLTGLVGVGFLAPETFGPAGPAPILIGGGVGLIVGFPALFIGLQLWADHDAAQERLI